MHWSREGFAAIEKKFHPFFCSGSSINMQGTWNYWLKDAWIKSNCLNQIKLKIIFELQLFKPSIMRALSQLLSYLGILRSIASAWDEPNLRPWTEDLRLQEMAIEGSSIGSSGATIHNGG
jgi:hypothetical protein